MSTPFEQVSEQVTKALEPLVDQPLTQRLLTEASALRDRTVRAQEATLAALNLPTAADLAKLERRIKSLSDALGDITDRLDRLETQVRRMEKADDAES
ncbi:hypothetical protein DJ010_00680 [Nocardioides silvaticus]|uniref:Uncharacterized protein n=1 Tax=Nocardioides silvaticus TaxID=2201891 RepID=A0A316TPS8_9ACTN|nr:hypothetical protein [Nocardioides silvaticus]PWN04204.1 hypothetical protein DJ010_00680 [Nocardioides silvaticus]